MKDLVYVNGNIVAKSGRHLAKEWIALAPDEYKENAVKIIDGDMYLDDNNQFLSYFSYAAKKGISSYIIGGIEIIPSPHNIKDLFDNDIKKIKELLNIPVPEHLDSELNRHLYVGIISDLELFLTEMLSCLVIGNEQFYYSFIEKTDCAAYLQVSKEELHSNPLKIYKYIHRSINYHRLKDIGEMYATIFSIDFPIDDRLQQMIPTRHDLAHRGGYTLKEHYIVHVEITKEMVYELIKVCELFIDNLMVALQESIAKWGDKITSNCHNKPDTKIETI